MGKFSRILEPGLNLLLPIIDRVRYVQSLKEIAIDIPQQSAITLDNVTLNIDGVLYLKVVDPYRASYGVEDPEFAITQLAQTTMRSELGKIALDSVFKERESLNIAIVDAINKASGAWGIVCLRYEIRDIRLPQRVHEAMQMQVEAERKKRAAVLESEGIREADINVAEGKRRARILASEAEKMELINKAQGEANATLAKAEAKAKALDWIAYRAAEARGGQRRLVYGGRAVRRRLQEPRQGKQHHHPSRQHGRRDVVGGPGNGHLQESRRPSRHPNPKGLGGVHE
ncbi:hypothetical protein HPB48_002793 [Haemaphysalis longicornis]|uniref:Band 7 domain-containing protein n=1 Tax=Haemaphysalis longicornis TaxID=44386 RepID=A0A9J6GNE0_HAELO|nr:hypothetical protein HPB48_002793 [Haemaphysalis longicornis]